MSHNGNNNGTQNYAAAGGALGNLPAQQQQAMQGITYVGGGGVQPMHQQHQQQVPASGAVVGSQHVSQLTVAEQKKVRDYRDFLDQAFTFLSSGEAHSEEAAKRLAEKAAIWVHPRERGGFSDHHHCRCCH